MGTCWKCALHGELGWKRPCLGVETQAWRKEGKEGKEERRGCGMMNRYSSMCGSFAGRNVSGLDVALLFVKDYYSSGGPRFKTSWLMLLDISSFPAHALAGVRPRRNLHHIPGWWSMDGRESWCAFRSKWPKGWSEGHADFGHRFRIDSDFLLFALQKAPPMVRALDRWALIRPKWITIERLWVKPWRPQRRLRLEARSTPRWSRKFFEYSDRWAECRLPRRYKC